METVEQEQYRGHDIKIYQDPDPTSPREDQENFGTMVCFHKRYNLGDNGHGINTDDFAGWGELEAYLIKKLDAAIILPMYLYDHSGITIRTSSFSCPWDSGRVGFIYATRQNIRDNYGIKRICKVTLERAKQLLEGEVKEYDRYLTGEVYGYQIEDADGEDVDSCWGYRGEPSDVITECKAIIDNIIKNESEEANKHYPKVEVFVTKAKNFRARIRESIVTPTYEVTIGGVEWSNGKGKNHRGKIQEQMEAIMRALAQGYEHTVHTK